MKAPTNNSQRDLEPETASREQLEADPLAALTASVFELLHALNSEASELTQLSASTEEEGSPDGTTGI